MTSVVVFLVIVAAAAAVAAASMPPGALRGLAVAVAGCAVTAAALIAIGRMG